VSWLNQTARHIILIVCTDPCKAINALQYDICANTIIIAFMFQPPFVIYRIFSSLSPYLYCSTNSIKCVLYSFHIRFW